MPELDDAASRIKDAMGMHAVAGSFGWVAFALSDGTSPDGNTVYPSWASAVYAQRWNRDNFVYIEIQPGGMPVREAAAFLSYRRKLVAAGYRVNPDNPNMGAFEVLPMQKRDRRAMASQLLAGRPMYPDGFVSSNDPSELSRYGKR
jgi:hypothetical protein